LYEEIFRKKIDSNSLVKDFKEKLKEIEDDVIEAYSKGKITELHYNLLNKKIAEYEENNH
jgi:ribosome-interacting GTPase 1